MLRRVIPLARNVSAVSRNQAVRCMSELYPKPVWKTDKEVAMENRTTMNDMPVPDGAWETYYKQRNSKYNVFLTMAAIFCIGTWSVVIGSGAMYLHDSPMGRRKN